MKTNLDRAKLLHSRGISLVEVLVVIAVIAILSSVAVPMVANATTLAQESRDHRNAQSLASLANNAVASGNLVLLEASDVTEVVDCLLKGVNGTGAFEQTRFQAHNLGEQEREAAEALLAWEGGVLAYHPAS